MWCHRVLFLFLVCLGLDGYAQEISPPYTLGNTLVTKFSGTVAPQKGHPGVDETFINPSQASVEIINVRQPKSVWHGQILDNKNKFSIPALAIGQVFGATFDAQGNAYVAATSVYGLHLITPDICEKEIKTKEEKSSCIKVDKKDKDVLPERVKVGQKHASWMHGQFGETGTPGSVWRIDGQTGKVRLFADITLDNQKNSGAALGNIAYDNVHQQFFVSDMDTGMIHRLSNKGDLLDYFDHGVTARAAQKQEVIAHDITNIINNKEPSFNALDTDTWGFATDGRLVWGLAVHQARLYYSVWNGAEQGSEIWSVALDLKGGFSKDSRLEIQVPEYKRHFKISDIAFTKQGAMVLAQHGDINPSYDYKKVVVGNNPRVLRYWLESPDDPDTKTKWILEPEEYAIGISGEHRNTAGGVALGYGYTAKGQLDIDACKETLWATGNDLIKQGSQYMVGLQGSPSRPVRDFNTPPKVSYFVPAYNQKDTANKGWVGDVEVFSKACACDNQCGITQNINPKEKSPVKPVKPLPPTVFPPQPPLPEFPICPYGLCGVVLVCIPPLDFWPWCDDGDSHPPACMDIETSPPAPFLSGTAWSFPITVSALNGGVIDTLKINPVTTGVTLTNGPVYPVGTPTPTFTAIPSVVGQDAVFNLCGYNSADAATGKPYDCCNMKVKLKVRDSLLEKDYQKLEVAQ